MDLPNPSGSDPGLKLFKVCGKGGWKKERKITMNPAAILIFGDLLKR